MQIGLNMQWNSISEFLHMGGYGFYVWGSFGVTAVALIGEMWMIRRQHLQTLQMLKSEWTHEEGLEGSTP